MALEALANTAVAAIQRRAPVLVTGDTPIGQAIDRMKDRRRGSALVQDADGRVVGVFTQHDVLMRVDLSNSEWPAIPVGDVMTPAPTTINAEASLWVALAAMHSGRFRSLPVVDAQGRPVGIVSIRDVLRHLADNFPEEFLNLPPDPSKESSRLYGG